MRLHARGPGATGAACKAGHTDNKEVHPFRQGGVATSVGKLIDHMRATSKRHQALRSVRRSPALRRGQVGFSGDTDLQLVPMQQRDVGARSSVDKKGHPQEQRLATVIKTLVQGSLTLFDY